MGMRKITVTTFRQSGKYYTTGEALTDAEQWFDMDREKLLLENDGKCPGVRTDGAEYHIHVTPTEDDWGYPILMPYGAPPRRPYRPIMGPGFYNE